MTQNVPFALPDPTYEGYTWTLQDEHSPAAHPPLIASAAQAVPSADAQNPDQPPASLNINGFNYARQGSDRAGAASPFGTITAPERLDDLTRWRQE